MTDSSDADERTIAGDPFAYEAAVQRAMSRR